MGVIKFDRDFETLFNWDTDDNPTMEQDYQNAVKNWTETEMNIVDTLLWQPTTEYTTGNIVKTPSLPSQYVLRCTETGTSGSTEPSYSGASAGDTVTDGTVEWVIVSLATGNAADVDASNIGVNAEVDNSEAWASAIGGGAIAEDDVRLVKGDTVYAVTSVMETNIATNTEAIEDNTENIATNTETIAQHTTDIDIAEKKISNIEKLLQGNLYDYQTDSTSAYTKTVPQGAMPYASLDSIGGKTLVWNQLSSMVGSASVVTSNGVTFTFDTTNLTCTLGGTASGGNATAARAVSVVAGHKYLLKGCPSGGGVNYWQSVSGSTSDGGSGSIFTESVGGTRYIIITVTNGTNADGLVFRSLLFDLTLMFGAGNEPSTLAEFESMFPASYYPYNAGTLLSAGVTEVKSVGKNIVDQDVIFGAVSGATKTSEGWQCGTSPLFTKYRNDYSTNDFPAIYSQSASLSFDVKLASADTEKVLYAGFADNENNRIAETINLTTNWQHITKTQTTTASARKVYFSYNNNTTVIIKNFQVEVGTTATTYSPYQENTYPIPAEIQALEGYGWSAGSVYNYIDYENKKFVKRVDSVDLGERTWTYNSSYHAFSTNYFVSRAKYSTTDGTLNTNFLAEKFMCTTVANPSSLTNYQFVLGTSGNLWVRTDGTGDTEPSGMFNYEIATPIEVDISAYLTDDNLIEVEAGGSLTFPNSNGDDYRIPVPSAETYMVDLQASL